MIDLVSFAPDCESLAWRLLGKTILIDTIDAALRLAEVAPAGYRWVTLKGEVLEADGTLHLGPMSGAAGLISRKSELRQLKEDIVETEERITDIQNQLQQLQQLQQQYEMVVQQRLQIDVKLRENQNALEEISKAEDTIPIFKSVGNLIIKAKKEEILKELQEEKETLSVRKKSLENQESRLKEKLEDLQKKIQEALKQ